MWLFAAYALLLLTENVMHFEGATNALLVAGTSILWVLLLVDYVHQIARAENRSRFLLRSLDYPIYLLCIVFVTDHNPWVIAVPLIVGFVMRLRRVAAGHAAGFALGLASFIVVIATLGVVYAEQTEPDSQLRDVGAAATWSLARIIHLRGYNGGDPLSADGQALSFVIAIAGLLVAALLTAEIVSWVIGDRQPGDREHSTPTERTSS